MAPVTQFELWLTKMISKQLKKECSPDEMNEPVWSLKTQLVNKLNGGTHIAGIAKKSTGRGWGDKGRRRSRVRSYISGEDDKKWSQIREEDGRRGPKRGAHGWSGEGCFMVEHRSQVCTSQLSLASMPTPSPKARL